MIYIQQQIYAQIWFFFHSQRTKRTKKNVGEIKLGLNKCYPHLQTATFLWESNLYTTFLCSIFFPKVLIMQKERDCDTFFPWMHSSESDHVHVVCNTHLQRGQMPALRGSMVCFTEVECPCFSFLLALAVCRIVNGWQITHTDYIPCILVLSVPFSPFHLFFPQKIQFQQFWWRCPINPRFCRMGFSISDLYKSYIGRTKIAFLQYLPSKCSHHLMKQTGFAISPWNKYNIKSVLHIYASYTTLVRNR